MRLSPILVIAASMLAVLASCGPSSPVGREVTIGGAPGSNPERNPGSGGRSGSPSPPRDPDGSSGLDAGVNRDGLSSGQPATMDASATKLDLGAPAADGPAVDTRPPPDAPPPKPPAPDAAPPEPSPPDAPADLAPDRPPIVETPPIEGALPCPPPLSADDIISDFEGGALTTVLAPGRGGTTWTVIALRDGATGAVAAPAIPPRCGSTAALRFFGLSTETQAPIVRALLVGTGDNRFFDASAYKSVRLALRAAIPSRIRLKISDRNTAVPGGVCVDCNDHFSANLIVDTEWRTFTVRFSALRQLGFGDPHPGLLTSAVFAIELVVPRVAGEYELFVDDVGFVE